MISGWRSAPFHIARMLLLLLPVTMLLGARAPLDIVGSTIAGLLLVHLIVSRDFTMLAKPWIYFGLAWWGWQIASSLWAYDAKEALIAGLIWGRFLLFAVAAAYWLITDDAYEWRLVAVITAVLAFLCIDTMVQYYTGTSLFGREKVGERLTGPFRGQPIVGSAILHLFLPLLALAMAARFQTRRDLALALLMACCVAVIIVSGERAAALLMGLGIALLLVLMRGAKSRWCGVAVLAGAGLLLAIQLGVLSEYSSMRSDYVAQRHTRETWDVVSRFSESIYGLLWRDAWQMIAEHPVLGVGERNIRVYWCEMGMQRYFPEGCAVHPHNVYLEIWGSTGTVGLLLYLGMVGALLRWFWRTRHLWRHDALTTGLVVAVLVRLWPLMFVTSHTRAISALLFWLMAGWAISRIQRLQK